MVTWGTIWQLQMLLQKLWSWLTELDCELLSSPDALWLLLVKFASSLEHGPWIHDFRPTWSCLIIEVLATWEKFLEPSGYCFMITCALIFCTTNAVGCFHSSLAKFELIKPKFLNSTTLHNHLCYFQIKHGWSNT